MFYNANGVTLVWNDAIKNRTLFAKNADEYFYNLIPFSLADSGGD